MCNNGYIALITVTNITLILSLPPILLPQNHLPRQREAFSGLSYAKTAYAVAYAV